MSHALARRYPEPAATGPVSVLIVDDSAVARAAISRAIEGDAGLRVAAATQGAEAAIAWLRHSRTDVILLDLEMPGRHGLSALPELIAAGGGAHVLIVSSSAREGAEATLKALALGAADTLTKPVAGLMGQSFGRVLTDRIRRLGRATNIQPAERIALLASASTPVELLAIGASTGGIRALDSFFAALPQSFAAPILVTQHLPASFMPYFADQLATMAGRATHVAADGDVLKPGTIIVAPGTAHLTVERTGTRFTVRLREGDVPSRCCPSVDPMFTSVAEAAGSGAVAVVLTGMGRDGANGAEMVVARGGTVIAQDRATSAVWGMPASVARAGLASIVGSPADLARHIAERGSA